MKIARNSTLALVLCLVGAGSSFAQVSILSTGANGTTQVNVGTGYTQNFNGLDAAATEDAAWSSGWTNNGNASNTYGLAGWYIVATNNSTVNTDYISGDGAGTVGLSAPDIVNYGVYSGTDRALGFFLNTSNTQNFYSGIVFKNSTGQAITSINVSYLAEVWRRNGVGSLTMDFAYKNLGASFSASTFALQSETGLMAVSALDFAYTTSSSAAGGTSAPVESSTISGTATLSTPLADGEYILLRWHALNSATSANNHRFGIDDLNIGFTTSSVPEPSSYALTAGMITLAGVCFLRRRNVPRR